MESKESKRGKSSSHRSYSHHDAVAPGSSSGTEAHSLKNFTIPKIRKTPEKVYLTSCYTNRREYSSISHAISQCRLDLSCELQSAWQFGETKLIHNDYLEKKYSAKRMEMREQGRRGCELEEHYCFLAMSSNAASRMYQNGLCTRESTLRMLGNPLLGVYLFRHPDVALNYARCRKHHVDNLVIFKVLYGKVKRIQPMVDKSKTCLDPSPNFDCHMSRLVPVPKEPVEQQAHSSAVYFYEYNTLSKPVDKPRQCLPYATLTLRFVGQKAESGQTITSLRFLSTGFPKWPEKRDSLNNCTIAKRIGKGKDATVIYEHFPKPAESSTQDSCSCKTEMNPLAPDTSSPCGNGQTNGFFPLGTTDGQPEHNLVENHNPSQAQATEADPPLSTSVDNTTQNKNGDMLISFNYLEKFLSTLSASVALANSISTSTVTTSKLIKDPRLLRRGGSHDQANPETDSGENLPLENREENPDSYVNALLSLPTDAALSSGAIPSEPMALSQGSLRPEGLSYEAALKRIFLQNYDYETLREITLGNAKKDQHNSDCQVGLSYASKEVVPKCENQEYGDKQAHDSSQMNRILLPIKKQAKRKYISEINHNTVTQELQPADLKIVHERFRPPPPPEPLQAQQETRNKFIQNTQDMKNLIPDKENHSKQEKNKLSKKRYSYDSTHGESKSSLRDNYLPHEKHKTLNLSHQDSDNCKKPRKHGPAVLMQSSSSSQEQEGKSNPKHVPFKSGNSYLPVNAEKSSKDCLEEWLKCERMYIDKYFSKPPKMAALKMGNMHLIPIDTKADVSQQKELVQTKEKPNDLINFSFNAKVPHFKVIREKSGKYPVVHGGNKNKPMPAAVLHKDGRPNSTLAEKVARNQDCPVFCDPMIENDLNVYYKEQDDPERQRGQSSSVGKNRMENIYKDEKQVVYMNKNCPTVVSDERKIKNACRSEVLYSEKFSSTYSLAWKKRYVSTKTALVENQNRISPGNQRGVLPSSESSNLPIPLSGTECGNNQKNLLEIAKAAQSPSFGAWGTNVFGEHEGVMDYSKPNEACEQPTINEDLKVLFPQDLNFNNEIEVESEQCEDSLLPQDTAIPENLSANEMDSVYQLLESRIDWENLFGSSWESSETSKSTLPQEDGSQHFLKGSSCIYSRTQKNHREPVNPVVVPDLQIQITNIIQSEFTLSQEPLAMQEEVVMCATPEIAEAEMTDAWQELESMAGPSQFTCENTDSSGKDELGLKVWPEASELMRDLVLSPPPDSSVHKAIKCPLALSSQPAASSPPTKDGSTCSLAKPRDTQNKSPKAKDVESKNGKGKLPASLKDKVTPSRSIRYAEAYGVTRKTTRHQSFEQFSSLSEGRIKTFSQSERHIRNVLNALYSEASLCKSKRLSRKLDRAVLHLKKAHRRVYRSLQLITKVGEKRRNGPLPKSYEFIRNSLWECCDLEGYNFLTERRYYSRHYWQKKKDDKREEKRASGLEVVRSRPPAPYHQGYSSSSSSSRDHQEVRRSLSIEGLSSEVSISHVNIPRITNSDRPHHSESRGSASSRGSLKDPRRGAEHKKPDKQLKAFPPPHADGQRSLDFIILSTIHTEKRSERFSSDVSSKEASSVVLSAPSPMERNVKFFNGLGGNNRSCFNSKPDLEGDGEIPSRANPDIFISILKSNTEQFFNVDVSKTDDLKLPRDFPQLCTSSEDVVGCSDSMAPYTNQERESVFLKFSGISVKNNETKWQSPHSETLSRSLPTVGSLATHLQFSPSLQEQPREQLKEWPQEQLQEQPQKQLQGQPPEQLKEQPKEQPQEQPQMQLQEQLEQPLIQLQEQPPEQPKNQLQEQPQMQVQEQLEQPQIQLQEQLQEQPPEQPKNQLQEQPQMQLQEQLEQPQIQLQEQLQEQPPEQPKNQLQEQPQMQLQEQLEQPQIQLQEQLQEQPPEQPKNQLQEQPQMQLQEQLEQPQIQLQEQLQEQPPEQPKNQLQEQLQKQSSEQLKDQLPKQPKDQLQEQSQMQLLERLEQPQMQLQEQLQKQSPEQLKDQPLEQPKDQPQKQLQECLQEQPQEQLQEQPLEQLLEQLKEQLQEQPLEQLLEQLKDQPLEQPKEQPQKQLQECLQEQPQEQLQEQPLEQPLEQPKDQPLEQPKEQPQKQLQEQPQEQLQEQMQEQPPEQLKDQLQDQPLELPQKQLQEQLQDQLQEQPKDQLQEQSQKQLHEQLQEQPQKQLQEQLEQLQEQLKEQLQEQSRELPQGQSQLQNDGKGVLGTIGMPEPLVKKNCKESSVEVVLMKTSLENTKSFSSQKSLVKKNDRKRQLRPVEKEQWPEKIVKKSNVLIGPLEKWPIRIVSLSKKVRVWDRSLAVAAPCSKKARHQEGRLEDDELAGPSSALPAAETGDPVCRWKGAPQTSIMKMHSGIPEATPAQQPEEGHSSKDPTTLIVKLSRILQKAEKASTLKTLQEQIRTCQTVLPLFIEAFERKQKCSFKHVLISRELLVEGNGWNNCRYRLHPQAVDSLVELQMMIGTMQFIENKKGLLGSERTFRSFLWYDASLYGELLRGNQGYQQQCCLYPAFQDRLKYNAFSELQHYHGQLTKLLEEARKGNKSYYAILKYKRQIEECEDIMKHCSNYFDFILSAPLTCGVNFGDNLEDLESLRKSTLELLSNQGHLPKIQSCPGKQDHLWIIMEMISSKIHFIKNSDSVSMKISLYGLEHIFFDAAKSLVWKEKGPSVSKSNSPKMEEELKFNQCAFKKFQQIYETLEADAQAEGVSKDWLEDTLGNNLSKRKHWDYLMGEGLGKGSFRFSDSLFSLPDTCCVGEILDQAESADLKQLEELTVRCTSHLETLKKCFQILQEAPVDRLLITEDNVLDVFKKHSHQVVILKPEAVEIYIEMVMLAETIHFLKNVKAKKLNKPRFRGMLWFDLSLLPELIENQGKNASFSLLKENAATCLWEAVEAAILELKDEAAVICEYPKGANSSYALQLLSRELTELSEIRTLLEKSNPPIATYVDLMPYTMSVNYGMTFSELEHNYNQFSELLQNLTLASQKDLGKMAHVMKVMKTIQYLKVSCAKMGSCNVSLFTCQMFSNSERACQQGMEKIRVIHKLKSSMVARKLEICCRESPSPLVLPHKDPAVSKKRPFTLALCESHQEQLESPDLPSHKKTKTDELLVTDEKTKEPKEPLQDTREKTTDGGGPPDPIPHPCLSQTRPWSPSGPAQGFLGPSCLFLLQGSPKDSPPTARGMAGKQESPMDIGGRSPPESLRKRSWSEGTLPGLPGLSPQTAKASLASLADALQATTLLAAANFPREASLHSAAQAEDSGFVSSDHEMLLDGAKSTQPPSTIPPDQVAVASQSGCSDPSEPLASLPPAPHQPAPPDQPTPASPGVCPFSQQQQPENMPGGCCNGSPQTTPQGSQAWAHFYHHFYPYHSWCVYHYCSGNGSSVTQTYQGITSCEEQPLPVAVALTPIYHVPANLLRCPGPEDAQSSSCGQALVPVQGLGFCTSHGPPFTAPPCTASQALLHVPCPCPPRPGSFPGVTCICASWQKGSFQNGH